MTKTLNQLNEATTLADDDLLLARDTSAVEDKRITLANLKQTAGINQRTIYVGSVAELVGITSPLDEARYETTSYHPGWNAMMQPPKGGAQFVWDAGRDKSDHNGGTVIDPNKTFPADWTVTADVTTWFTADGAGQGCFVQVFNGPIYVDTFGARPEDSAVTLDNILPIQAAIDALPGGTVMLSLGYYGIGAPVKLRRGIRLMGAGPFDTRDGAASWLKMLPGSNSAAIQTPAALGEVATHFMALENLGIDGNKTAQTAEVSEGLVQFWGAFVGSWLRNVFIFNSLGPALTFDKGCDIQLDHIWINGTQTTGYALDSNMSQPVGSRLGLLNGNYVFVENTTNKVGGDPRNVEADRGKAIRLRQFVTANIDEFHIESADYPIDIADNHAVRIGKISGTFLGNSANSDNALVRFTSAGTRATDIGTMRMDSQVAGMKFVGLASGVSSQNYISEMPAGNDTAPYANGYSMINADFATSKESQSLFSRKLGVEAVGTGNPDFGLYSAGSVDRHYFSRNGDNLNIGSSANQASDKNFIEIISAGSASDRIQLKAYVNLHELGSAANVTQGSLWRSDGTPGFGVGPVYQAEIGSNARADAIASVRRGSGAPTVSADYIGQMFVDVSNRDGYLAVNFGTGASDWKKITP